MLLRQSSGGEGVNVVNLFRGLYGEDLPERGPFIMLEINKREVLESKKADGFVFMRVSPLK